MNAESKAALASIKAAAARDATWDEWDALIQELPPHVLSRLADKAGSKLDEETRERAERAKIADNLAPSLVEMCTAVRMAAIGEGHLASGTEENWSHGIHAIVRLASHAMDYAELMAAVVEGRRPRWILDVHPNCLPLDWESSPDGGQ